MPLRRRWHRGRRDWRPRNHGRWRLPTLGVKGAEREVVGVYVLWTAHRQGAPDALVARLGAVCRAQYDCRLSVDLMRRTWPEQLLHSSQDEARDAVQRQRVSTRPEQRIVRFNQRAVTSRKCHGCCDDGATDGRFATAPGRQSSGFLEDDAGVGAAEAGRVDQDVTALVVLGPVGCEAQRRQCGK